MLLKFEDLFQLIFVRPFEYFLSAFSSLYNIFKSARIKIYREIPTFQEIWRPVIVLSNSS